MEQAFLLNLQDRPCFSREELAAAMAGAGRALSMANFKAKLQQLLQRGSIARAGRNAYYVPAAGVQPYTCLYSPQAQAVAKLVQSGYPYVDFTVTELRQLNEFVNHQLAHNTVFVDVEADAMEFVFDFLREHYPGKVLLQPTPDIYHAYWMDDLIVVQRLITEAPRTRQARWQARLEKILVDVLVSKLLHSIVSVSELPAIYEESFSKYIIDESSLFRYAQRRHAAQRLRTFITEQTSIQLRLEHTC